MSRVLVVLLGFAFFGLGLGMLADIDFHIGENLGGSFYLAWKQNVDGDRIIEEEEE